MPFLSNQSPFVRMGALAGFAVTSLLSFSVSASPKGKPFVEIDESLLEFNARLDSLADTLDDHVMFTVQGNSINNSGCTY